MNDLVQSVKFDSILATASPIVAADGTIFVASVSGILRAFQKVPLPVGAGGDFWQTDDTSYSLVWSATIFPTPVVATPVIAAVPPSGSYVVIATSGSIAMAVSGRPGAANFAERWRVDLCEDAAVLDRWVSQFGAATPCALFLDGSPTPTPTIAGGGGGVFACGHGGAGPVFGVCAALAAADGAVVWRSFIIFSGFR